MAREPQITKQTLRVLGAFLSDSNSDRYGLEICDMTGLPYGTVQPMLRRLERAGWLEADWEDIDQSQEGRRARRYYRLTSKGRARAREEWDEVQAILSLRPTTALGSAL